MINYSELHCAECGEVVAIIKNNEYIMVNRPHPCDQKKEPEELAFKEYGPNEEGIIN